MAAKLKSAILRLQKTLASLEARIEALESDPQSEANAEAHSDDRLDALENAVQAAMDRLDRHEDKFNSASTEAPAAPVLTEEPAAWTVKLETFEARLAALETQKSAPPTAPDDLTAIKGIGPKYQRLLRQQGISSFAAIAAWSDEDVERVAKEIGIKSSRIRSLDWIGSAQALSSSTA